MLQVTPVKWDICLRLVVIDTLEIVRGSASLFAAAVTEIHRDGQLQPDAEAA